MFLDYLVSHLINRDTKNWYDHTIHKVFPPTNQYCVKNVNICRGRLD